MSNSISIPPIPSAPSRHVRYHVTSATQPHEVTCQCGMTESEYLAFEMAAMAQAATDKAIAGFENGTAPKPHRSTRAGRTFAE